MIYAKLYLKRTPSGQTYEKRLNTKKSLTNLKEESFVRGFNHTDNKKVGRFPLKILPFHLFQTPHSAHVAISKNLGPWKLSFAS
jgi:hypothetical protein